MEASTQQTPGRLILEDGASFDGFLFGTKEMAVGEVVFSTGMVGYNESLTDPSYRKQVLVFTYPSIGNYGVPDATVDEYGLQSNFESSRVHVGGVVVANVADDTSHYAATRSLPDWLKGQGVSGLSGVDTRRLTQHLRDKGSMSGAIVTDGSEPDFTVDPQWNPVDEVSITEPREYGPTSRPGRTDGPRVVLLDTGVKESIIRLLVRAGARVLRVPWNYDFFGESFDGLLLANGPGDPKRADASIALVRRALAEKVPTFGICFGHQLMALAAGADTYKLKFGHRGHNQPCIEVGTQRCYITSQNHGYAVDGTTLPEGWREWFVNANDRTNEGIRHEYQPARSVQFHPEAAPGPTDTAHLLGLFMEMLP